MTETDRYLVQTLICLS